MTFIEPSVLVISSNHHHYLLKVTFTGSEVTNNATYAGSRGHAGTDYVKYRLEMRIESPSGADFDGYRALYAAVDTHNTISKLLEIDTLTGQGQLICQVHQQVRRLNSDEFSGGIYFTTGSRFGVIEMNEGTTAVRILVGGGGDGTGALGDSQLKNPLSFTQVKEKFWLICDNGNHR